MHRDELSGWLRLTLTSGVGNATARKLLAAFGPPAKVFAQSHTALAQVIGPELARGLQNEPKGLAALLETTWNWLQHLPTSPAKNVKATADGQAAAPVWRHIVALDDADYPAGLLNMADPPLLLYMMGCGHWLSLPDAAAAVELASPENQSNSTIAPVFTQEFATVLIANSFHNSIAIVGSRSPTPQGQDNARQFAHALASGGAVVVSGMALGVDGAAHEGALVAWQQAAQSQSNESLGMQALPLQLATIAVVGTGLDRVYPTAHLTLAREIARCGLIVSEYPLGTPPLAANFPKRNRIIAGLSQGTLVVEAALKSGSLITARLAIEQGKDVFAIPGSIHSVTARGCNALIRDGAKLVELPQDVLEDLRLQRQAQTMDAAMPRAANTLQAGNSRARPKKQNAPEFIANNQANTGAISRFDDQNDLLTAIGHDPVSLDALQARTGLPTPQLQAELMALELDGHVARLPGGLFQRMAQA